MPGRIEAAGTRYVPYSFIARDIWGLRHTSLFTSSLAFLLHAALLRCELWRGWCRHGASSLLPRRERCLVALHASQPCGLCGGMAMPVSAYCVLQVLAPRTDVQACSPCLCLAGRAVKLGCSCLAKWQWWYCSCSVVCCCCRLARGCVQATAQAFLS